MKILVAFDSFKGCVAGDTASEYVASGLRARGFDAATYPLADGGEGTADALLQLVGGQKVTVDTVDAYGASVEAEAVILQNGSAAIDMASCCGLGSAEGTKRARVMQTSSYGLGLAIKQISELWHPAEIVVGLGGSASCDGGVGMLQALGAEFQWNGMNPLYATGNDLLRICSVDTSKIHMKSRLIFLRDVSAPLTGSLGAAMRYAPQKGASPTDVLVLENGLRHWASIAIADVQEKGMGAAGGVSVAGKLLEAQMFWGAEYVIDLYSRQLSGVDIVITGEGRTDAQTLQGKAPLVLAQRAKAHGASVMLLSGRVDVDINILQSAGFDTICEISPRPATAADMELSTTLNRLLFYTLQNIK